LQRWRPALPPHEGNAPPYETTCSCGRSLRGWRQRSGQTLTCTSCGRKRFVFASSPWPGGEPSALLPSTAAPPAAAVRGNLARLLVVILIGAATAMTLLFLIIKPYLRRSTPPPTPAITVHTHIKAGQQL